MIKSIAGIAWDRGTTLPTTDEINAMWAAGARHIKLDADWATIEPSDDSYTWYLDATLNALVAKGFEVTLTAINTPSWAQQGGAGANYRPTTLQDFADFFADLVNRYVPYGVLRYEVWSNPNTDGFATTTGTIEQKITDYAAMLKLAYTDAKAAQSSCYIIAGGTAPYGLVGDFEGTDINPVTWYESLYADETIQGYFDAIGHHPFCYPSDPSDPSDASAWSQMYRTTTSLRSVMTAYGDGSKLIEATQSGAPTSNDPGALTLSQQANYISLGADDWINEDWTGVLYNYDWRDNDVSGVYFGLINESYQQKTSYDTFYSKSKQYQDVVYDPDAGALAPYGFTLSEGASSAAYIQYTFTLPSDANRTRARLVRFTSQPDSATVPGDGTTVVDNTSTSGSSFSAEDGPLSSDVYWYEIFVEDAQGDFTRSGALKYIVYQTGTNATSFNVDWSGENDTDPPDSNYFIENNNGQISNQEAEVVTLNTEKYLELRGQASVQDTWGSIVVERKEPLIIEDSTTINITFQHEGTGSSIIYLTDSPGNDDSVTGPNFLRIYASASNTWKLESREAGGTINALTFDAGGTTLGKMEPPDGKCYSGLLTTTGNTTDYTSWLSQVDSPLAIHGWFSNIHDSDGTFIFNFFADHVEVPFWKMRTHIGEAASASNQDYANGAWDYRIVRTQKKLAQYNFTPIFINPFWEMTGYWFNWCAYNSDGTSKGAAYSTDQYKRMWKRLVILFEGGDIATINSRLSAEGLPNLATTDTSLPTIDVVWVWNASAAPRPNIATQPGNHGINYYVDGNVPGTSRPYIDWVGQSTYGYPENASSAGARQDHDQQMAEAGSGNELYDLLSNPATSQYKKPWLAGEWGIRDGSSDGPLGLAGTDETNWLTKKFTWFKSRPKVKSINYFNNDAHDGNSDLTSYHPNNRSVYSSQINDSRYLKNPSDVKDYSTGSANIPAQATDVKITLNITLNDLEVLIDDVVIYTKKVFNLSFKEAYLGFETATPNTSVHKMRIKNIEIGDKIISSGVITDIVTKSGKYYYIAYSTASNYVNSKRNADTYPVNIAIPPDTFSVTNVGNNVLGTVIVAEDLHTVISGQNFGRKNLKVYRKNTPWTNNDTTGATLVRILE